MGSSARSSHLVGTRLGAYEVVRLAGHGATASVFEGVHAILGKRVALKVLHEHLTRDEMITARFLREGRVAARLQHPNILEVLDLGWEGGTAWLVMEYLEGRDLREELVRRGRLPAEEAIALLLPIASALSYAHSQGAVHRDVKPANVFLARDDHDHVVPKVVDFGLSKLDGLNESHPLTESEIVAGSVSYMAPEQTYGIALAGPAADQFSFGVVLYECLTGHPPFTARTFYDLIERIRESRPRPPSQEVLELPAGLDAVVLRCLAADPADRASSMRVVGAELLEFASESTRIGWADAFTDAPDTVRNIVASPRGLRAAPVSRPFPGGVDDCPPLPCPAGTSPFFIKGLPYRGFVYFASRSLSRGLGELCDALEDAELADFIRQPFLASSRYDLLPLRPLTAALARLLDRDFDELVADTAAAQARYDARTVFRRMFAGATLDDWHERIARFGAQYYGFGHSEGIREERGVVISRHVGVPEYMTPWFGPMQAAYGRESARILGGKDVTAELLPFAASDPVDGLRTVTSQVRVTWTT